jgi:hypothetical protein
MSVEHRLRAGLNADAETITPAVEAELATVIARVAVRRRRRWATRAGAAGLAAAAAVALILVVGGRQPAGGPGPAHDPAPDTSVLAGEYVVDVPATAAARRLGMAGRWVVRIGQDGLMDLTPPARAELSQPLSGAFVRVEEDRIETNAFIGAMPGCQSGDALGSYRWSLQGSVLTFYELGEDCAGRTALFLDAAWERVP